MKTKLGDKNQILLLQMYTFCDGNYIMPNGDANSPAFEVLHDKEADHLHNHVCQRQSAWQLLRDHPDFDPSKSKCITGTQGSSRF